MRPIILLSIFATIWWGTDACSCIALTQQNSYCLSNWISHARVLGKQNLGNSVEYTVQHIEVFKSHTSMLPNKVFTTSSSTACGQTNLNIGTDYLLSGTINSGTQALQLSTCLYMPGDDYQTTGVLQWNQVPADLYQRLQKKNFQACPVS
uniref:NTR domain-containing protein n=1 Tax=Panagrolaimus sp. JU765 TaxID=591449 RepID=A0AC34QEU4_9BILA